VLFELSAEPLEREKKKTASSKFTLTIAWNSSMFHLGGGCEGTEVQWPLLFGEHIRRNCRSRISNGFAVI
jgi:hypothetical protein